MRTHPLQVGYLVVGLVFLGLAGSWTLRETGVIDRDGFQWVLPATLLAAGAVGLVASLTKSLRRRGEDPANGSWVGEDEPSSADEDGWVR